MFQQQQLPLPFLHFSSSNSSPGGVGRQLCWSQLADHKWRISMVVFQRIMRVYALRGCSYFGRKSRWGSSRYPSFPALERDCCHTVGHYLIERIGQVLFGNVPHQAEYLWSRQGNTGGFEKIFSTCICFFCQAQSPLSTPGQLLVRISKRQERRGPR